MKLIVAGATGFVGSEVLFAALQHPAVTRVVSLSRRAVIDPRIVKHAKWESILLEDFEHYPPDAMAKMQGAVGCIWSETHTPLRCSSLLTRVPFTRAIGGLAPKFSNYETLHKANVVYPVAAAHKFADTLAPDLGPHRRFKFVFVSGALAERNQKAQLWTLRDSRRVKGEAEVSLLDIANSSATGSFETLIARPGFVLGKGDVKSFVLGFTGPTRTISVQDLASVLVDMAINGADVFGGKDTADNVALVHRAKELREL